MERMITERVTYCVESRGPPSPHEDEGMEGHEGQGDHGRYYMPGDWRIKKGII